jgi:hypothetical protein
MMLPVREMRPESGQFGTSIWEKIEARDGKNQRPRHDPTALAKPDLERSHNSQSRRWGSASGGEYRRRPSDDGARPSRGCRYRSGRDERKTARSKLSNAFFELRRKDAKANQDRRIGARPGESKIRDKQDGLDAHDGLHGLGRRISDEVRLLGRRERPGTKRCLTIGGMVMFGYRSSREKKGESGTQRGL